LLLATEERAMQIDSTSHRSPNHEPRQGRAVELLVVHSTVGSLSSSLGWLCNPASQAGAHYVIAKNGRIFQLVADDQAAWHAGRSRYADWGGANPVRRSLEVKLRSIGIELENLNGVRVVDPKTKKLVRVISGDPYTPAQILALTTLVASLRVAHRVPKAGVVRHADIAIPAGRKRDPLEFDWPRWYASLT
jgi:N-acetylmuramoyl-L-alanine amidase